MLTNKNSGKKVVCTEISNLALKINLEERGYVLIETELGDRIVVDAALENKAIIGAETSGHYFFPEYCKTMDGMIAFLHFSKLLHKYGENLIYELGSLKHFNRVSKNYKVNGIKQSKIDKIGIMLNHMIRDDEKFIIRKSMWDPVVRVYYDYEGVNLFREYEKLVHEYILK